MKAFFFGDAASPLFGAYHEGEGRVRGPAVLLCYPAAHDYNMSHWAFRRLAAQLSRGGAAVLRFDWFGTGDSAGATDEGSIERWIADLAMAARELKDHAGARPLAIVGKGLGASLAVLAGVKAQRLLLWNPIISGAPYLEALDELHLRRKLQLLHTDAADGDQLGYPVKSELRTALASLDLRGAATPEGARITVLLDQPDPLAVEWATAVDADLEQVTEKAHAQEREAAMLSAEMVSALVRRIADGT